MTLRVSAPAKVNLALRVFAPDTTGYHPLETLFCALDLADEITLDPRAEGLHLEVSGADLGPPRANLAWRAAEEFFRTTGLPPRGAIHLTKHIPAGGGLGGGSSDAAAVLNALNEFHHGVLGSADLLSIAARLGSDVAFFLCGSSLAFATGRGEKLRTLPPLPAAPAILLVPPFGIATRDAYRWLDDAAAYSAQGPLLPATDWPTVAAHASNAFESVVFRKHPVLAELKAALQEGGALFALLSGSGSTVFGIYSSGPARDAAVLAMRRTVKDAAIVPTTTRA